MNIGEGIDELEPYRADMARDVLPSRLLAYLLAWRYRRGTLHIPKLAKQLGCTPASIHNWISAERGARRGIHERFWSPMARFFGFALPEELLAAARSLYVGTNGTLSREVRLENPATPQLVREFLRESAATTESHPTQHSAPRVTGSKTRETP